MSHAQIATVGDYRVHETALIASDDSVWVAVKIRWWDLAVLLWWWLCPADRKAWTTLTVKDGKSVRTRAIRIAKRHIRIRTLPHSLSNT